VAKDLSGDTAAWLVDDALPTLLRVAPINGDCRSSAAVWKAASIGSDTGPLAR